MEKPTWSAKEKAEVYWWAARKSRFAKYHVTGELQSSPCFK